MMKMLAIHGGRDNLSPKDTLQCRINESTSIKGFYRCFLRQTAILRDINLAQIISITRYAIHRVEWCAVIMEG